MDALLFALYVSAHPVLLQILDPHLLEQATESIMSRAGTLCLCLLLAAAGGAAALDLLDPSSLVEALSSAGVGVEKWHRPDFW